MQQNWIRDAGIVLMGMSFIAITTSLPPGGGLAGAVAAPYGALWGGLAGWRIGSLCRTWLDRRGRQNPQ